MGGLLNDDVETSHTSQTTLSEAHSRRKVSSLGKQPPTRARLLCLRRTRAEKSRPWVSNLPHEPDYFV